MGFQNSKKFENHWSIEYDYEEGGGGGRARIERAQHYLHENYNLPEIF